MIGSLEIKLNPVHVEEDLLKANMSILKYFK